MRRSGTILLAFVVAASLGAGPAGVSDELRTLLERSLSNEREAAARYDAFAARAGEEGYRGAAALFRAAGHGERVHAKRIEAAMKTRGIPIPEPVSTEQTVGSTAENLRQAASLEIAERDGVYRRALAASQDERDDGLARVFDQTRDCEVEHANLMSAAARQLETMKRPKIYYVCDTCGFTSDVELPYCMLCRAKKHPRAID